MKPTSSRGATAAHVVSLAAAYMAVLYVVRHQWFFGDEWDFISSSAGVSGAPGLWTPHSEHWSTLPMLVWHGLYALFGLKTYLPYLAVLIACHVTLVHLVWRLMRRAAVTPWLATGVAATLLVFGAGWEDLTWAFQIGFIGALMAGMAGLLLVAQSRSHRRLAVVWVVLVAGLMCSGIGVLSVVIVAIAAWLRWGWRRGVLVAAVPAGVYIIWALAVRYSHSTSVSHDLETPVSAYIGLVAYVWQGMVATFEGLGIPVVAVVLLVALSAWLVKNWRTPVVTPEVRAAAVGVPLLFVLIGIGRIHFGPGQASSSRYVYLAAMLLAPVAGAALDRAVRAGRGNRVVIALGLGFVAVHGAVTLDTYAAHWAGIKQAGREQILAAATYVGDATVIGAVPDPVTAATLRFSQLSVYARSGALPPLTTPPDERTRLSVQTALQVAVTTASQGPLFPGSGGATETDTSLRVMGGCVAEPGPDGSLDITFNAPGSLELSGSSGTVTYRTLAPGRSVAGVEPASAPLSSRGWINVSIPMRLEITLPGDARLCGFATGQ